MDGRYHFDRPSTNPNARVINQGRISLGERGLGALVAPHARNDGVIQGRASTVVIAGTETFTVDLYGDGLINFKTRSPVTRHPEGVDALAENNGLIRTDGGRVLITAVAAEGIIDRVIQVGGKIHARSATRKGGVIVLDGGRHGTVAVTGTLDASSTQRGGRGGRIDVRGRRLAIGPRALVKANGPGGGGDIRIGGDRGGKGPGRKADAVVLASEARIMADAIVSGDGGSIIIYGKENAEIAGALTARGGPEGGDGGFIETSAKTVTIAADTRIDASAPAGKPGTWLIDPTDITIDAGMTNRLVATLEGGTNVEVNTSAPPYGDPDDTDVGNITVEASIRPDLAAAYGNQTVTLTLSADNNVTMDSGVTIGPEPGKADAGDSMGVTITAGNDITPKRLPF